MPKNIVICCDGTDNEIASDSTNVLRLFRMLERNERQIAYYDAGVGTLVDPAAISTFRKQLSKRLDAAMGLRVRENAIAAYRFLSQTYEPDDRLFFFGFSRGAYTARAVAGMIHFLGLIHPEHDNLAELAWGIYANEANAHVVSQRFAGGNRFNRCFGIAAKPKIHFMGVWDTVSSFGFFLDFRRLPFTANNPSIVYIRHALAIDERRACFAANLFGQTDRTDKKDDNDQEYTKQVWFAGVHADVGGGYPEKEATLAKVPLTWMLREAETQGLLINDGQRTYLMDSKDKPPADVCGPIHESLKGFWRVIEWIPRRSFDSVSTSMRWRFPHFGRRRTIAENSRVHASVLSRMNQIGYAPLNLPKAFLTEN
jgi:uncharacterized protein (DUF2235 family)